MVLFLFVLAIIVITKAVEIIEMFESVLEVLADFRWGGLTEKALERRSESWVSSRSKSLQNSLEEDLNSPKEAALK